MDLNIVVAVFAGIGTVLGTFVAAEKYLSSKFIKAVKSTLSELEIDRQLRHIKRDYQSLATVVDRLQHEFTDLGLREESEREKLQNELDRVWASLNALKIKHAKLESAARVLGAELKGKSSISAILQMETQQEQF